MFKNQFSISLLFLGTVLIAACGGDSESLNSAPKKAVLAAPFRFQRSLEVKPGLIFDVLTWGRGKILPRPYSFCVPILRIKNLRL
jgi:hypothetical protein